MRLRVGHGPGLLVLGAVAASLGCGVRPGAAVSAPAAQAAPTATLSASPATIVHGQAATLSWQTTNATTVSVSGIGFVAPSGSQAVTPSSTTNYQLTATGQEGQAQAAATVTVQPPVPKKVVFIGASITQYWDSYADFAANNWIDKGIAGQTSVQVAARFESDVIALNPDAVHILVGTNDLNANWIPQTTWDAFTSMIAEAKAAGIAVAIGTVPPWGAGPGAARSDPDYVDRNMRVAMLNAWLKTRPGVTVIDYYSLLVGGNRLYNPAMTTDGIHPNAAGYAVMTPAAEAALW
jgi:lysophospholipase L1-like esterase